MTEAISERVIDPGIHSDLDGTEPAVGGGESQELEVPDWNLRPIETSQGYEVGREGRQRARIEHLISVGALAEGIKKGVIVRDYHDLKQKITVRETVIACVPIPIKDMVPNAEEELEGYVTPLWPIDKPRWIMDNSNKFSRIPPKKSN